MALFLAVLLLLGQSVIALGDAETLTSETPSRGARPAWVANDRLPVLVEPDEGALVASYLTPKQKVMVRREGPSGWLAIEPPPGSFSWIEKRAIEDLGEGRGRVAVSAAAVRAGRDDISLPTGPWVTLRRGADLVLLDRPPLILRQGEERRVWYAIKPPASEVRYIQAGGVVWSDPAELGPEGDQNDAGLRFDFVTRSSGIGQMEPPQRLDPEFIAVGPLAREVGLAPEFEAKLGRVEQSHRSELLRPIESWNLDAIEAEYIKLLNQSSTGNEKQAVELRLAQLRRQVHSATTARSLREMIAGSRQRDLEIYKIRDRLGKIADGAETPYDAEGLLQSSSTMLEGRKALVLINDVGKTDAYLHLPPGLRKEDYVSARVGIRGDSRYDTRLKARVITVNEIDRLDTAP